MKVQNKMKIDIAMMLIEINNLNSKPKIKSPEMEKNQVEKIHKMLVAGALFVETIKEVLADPGINNVKQENKKKLKNFIEFKDNLFQHYLTQLKQDNIATTMVIRDLASIDRFATATKQLTTFEFNLLAAIHKDIITNIENENYTIDLTEIINNYDGSDAKYYICQMLKDMKFPVAFELFKNNEIIKFDYNEESTGNSMIYLKDSNGFKVDELTNLEAVALAKEITNHMNNLFNKNSK